MGFRRTRPLALACVLALLSACQAPQSGVQNRFWAPTFRMQAADGAVEGRAAVAVTPAGTPQAAKPTYDGELTVKFAHLLGERRLMATVADVKSLTIQLSGNGVNHTETISEAMIVNGMTSFTFTGLPAGSLTVTIQAKDATGKVIGSDIQQATITGGQTTVVASAVMIAPTVTAPQVIVTGGSGGSGTGGSTGSLTANVTLVDGAPVQNATLVAAYPNNVSPHAVSLVRDNQGNVWFTGGTTTVGKTWRDGEGLLKRVSAAGAVTTVDPGGLGAGVLGASADGAKVYVTTFDMDTLTDPDLMINATHAFNADGTPTAIPGTSGAFVATALEGAPDGTTFTAGLDMFFFGIKADGTFGFNKMEDVASDLRVTSTGEPVYSFPYYDDTQTTGHRIVRLHADGTEAFSHSLYIGEDDGFDDGLTIGLDAQDHVWYALPSQQAVRELSPTGAVLGTYALPARANAVTTDASGRIWAYQSPQAMWSYVASPTERPAGAPDDLLMRLDADGKVVAFYHLGLGVDVNELVVTADDHLWVASPTKGLLHYTLPPAPVAGP